MKIFHLTLLVLFLLVSTVFIIGCSGEAAPAGPDTSQPSGSPTKPAVPTPTLIAPPVVSPCTSPCALVSLGLVGAVLGSRKKRL